MFENKLCVICALPCTRHLCKLHIKAYTYDKRYGVFKLKPKIKISKGQRDLFQHIRGIFRSPTFQEVIFEWNPFSRYDIVVMDKRLIIEYDGQQHFIYNEHFHKSLLGFKDYIEKDKKKEVVADMYGYKLIRFSYIEHVEDLSYVEKALKLKLK